MFMQFLRRTGSPLGKKTITTLGKQEFPNVQGGKFFPWTHSARMRNLKGAIWMPHRSSSVVPRMGFEGNILRLLEYEIKYEMGSNPPTEIATDGIPFTVEDKPGEIWIVLRRKYGEEDIKVEVTLIDTESPDQGDDDGENIPCQISLAVTISKGEGTPSMVIGCSAYPDEIAVDGVAIKEWRPPNQVPYEGPNFRDLEENLQEAFNEYLEVRGIDGNLSNFLHQYMLSKNQKEYLQWLQIVKSFMEK
eukprot:Gb_00756 [translate_table: standard]